MKPEPVAVTSILERPVILRLDAPPAPAAPEGDVLAAAGTQAEFLDWGGGASDADRQALARADFILTWHTPVDAALIAQARRCLLIIHYGLGSGRGTACVALEAARQAGIYVASLPDYATASWVGETLRLLDLLTREAPAGPRRALAGLRLGLVGFGQVGRHVAREAARLKMEVWACDPFAPDEPFATAGVRRADLDTLCGISDILSLHAPLSPATRGMMGAGPLGLLKPEALLIDSSAPELVDLDALAVALAQGRLAAAAFDEDLAALLLPAHPLLAQPALRHGPRRAGVGEPWYSACRRAAAELVVYVLRGNRPRHLLIDPPCPRHILALAGY